MINWQRISGADPISIGKSRTLLQSELEIVRRQPSELVAEVKRWQKEVAASS